jgi:hypothetical protein
MLCSYRPYNSIFSLSSLSIFLSSIFFIYSSWSLIMRFPWWRYKSVFDSTFDSGPMGGIWFYSDWIFHSFIWIYVCCSSLVVFLKLFLVQGPLGLGWGVVILRIFLFIRNFSNPSVSFSFWALGWPNDLFRGKSLNRWPWPWNLRHRKGMCLKSIFQIHSLSLYLRMIEVGNSFEKSWYTQILWNELYLPRCVASSIRTKKPNIFQIPSKISGCQYSCGRKYRRIDIGVSMKYSFSGMKFSFHMRKYNPAKL